MKAMMYSQPNMVGLENPDRDFCLTPSPLSATFPVLPRQTERRRVGGPFLKGLGAASLPPILSRRVFLSKEGAKGPDQV